MNVALLELGKHLGVSNIIVLGQEAQCFLCLFKERKLKEEIVGKVFSTNKSGDCVVTKYVGCNEVHIKFVDTDFERVTDANSLRKASVKDTSLTKTVKKYVVGKENIVGKVFENSKGEQYEVLEKLSTTRFKVKFIDSGYETETSKISIEIGELKDRSNLDKIKSSYGFDHSKNKYDGVSNKTVKELATLRGLNKEYTIWSNIVGRCNRGYAKLHEDFYTFDSWLSWAKNQKGFMCRDDSGSLYQLESDLFSGEVKTYSPETCVFLPKELNCLCKPTVGRTKLPRGVSKFGSKDKPYRASISLNKVTIHLGNYSTLEEAASVSKQARINRVNVLEEKYKCLVDSVVFDELRKDRWIV